MIFVSKLKELINAAITNDYWSTVLPMDGLATSSANSPALYAYYASLNILDAKGLFSNAKIRDLLQQGIRAKKSALERHHLFPKAYLEKIGVSEQSERNQIANYALIEWDDNIDISDEAPTSYVPKFISRFNDEEINQMYKWHGLSIAWEQMEYKEFLVERRKLISGVIKEAFTTLSNR